MKSSRKLSLKSRKSIRKSLKSRKSIRKSLKSRKSIRKSLKSRKSIRKSRKSRKSAQKSLKSRKSVSKKSARKSKQNKSVSKKSKRKEVPPPKPFVIPYEILEKLDQSGFRLGELLGEGAFGIVYEVYKKNEEKKQDNRYVLKIAKQNSSGEEIPLRELGELVKQLDNHAVIIKYCGESLFDKWNREPHFMPLKDAVITLLEDVREIHKKHWTHNDIKPDNICVQQKKDGTYRLKLMDFGQAKRLYYEDRHPFGDTILSKYKKEYNGIISVNDFKQKNIPVERLNIVKFKGNIYWAVRPAFYPSSGVMFKTYDDVESIALSLWELYGNDLPWAKYYKEYSNKIIPKDVRYEIIRQRLNENLCPFEILREVLREAWNGSKMDLDGLIKRLKQNY